MFGEQKGKSENFARLRGGFDDIIIFFKKNICRNVKDSH